MLKKKKLWKKKRRIPHNTTIQKTIVYETHAVYFMGMQMFFFKESDLQYIFSPNLHILSNQLRLL